MTVPSRPRSRHQTLESDLDLLTAVRDGDRRAYATLWDRHAAYIRKAASFFTSFDADDITAEAFLRTLRAIERGHGPRDAFRSYALATARNIAAEWARKQRTVSFEVTGDIEDAAQSMFASDLADDNSLAVKAYQSLPTRWREVLWYSEVERMKPAEIAPLLGMSANSVAALALRAREGLRQGFIAAHLQSEQVPAEHRWVIENAAKYARKKLPMRSRERVDEHLETCLSCRAAYADVTYASSRIAVVLLPIVLGTAAPAYAAWAASRSTDADTDTVASSTSRKRRRTITAVVAGSLGVVLLGAGLTWASTRPHTDDSTATASITHAASPPKAAEPAPPLIPTVPGTAPRSDSRPAPSGTPALPPQQPASRITGSSTDVDPPVVAPIPPARPDSSPTAPPTTSAPPAAPPSGATPSTPPPPAPPKLTLAAQQDAPYLVPGLHGTGVPGQPVTLTWRNPTQTLTFTAPVRSDGTWTQSPPDLPAAGTYDITAEQLSDGRRTSVVSGTSTLSVLITDELQIAPRELGADYVLAVRGHAGAAISALWSDGTTLTTNLDATGAGALICPKAADAQHPVIVTVRYVTPTAHGVDHDLSALYSDATG